MRSRVFNLVKARVGALRARYSIVPVIVEKFVCDIEDTLDRPRYVRERMLIARTHSQRKFDPWCMCGRPDTVMVRTIDKIINANEKTQIHTQNNPSSIMFTSVTSVYYASLLVVLLVSWSSRSHSGCQAFSLSTTSKVSSSSATQLYASTELKTLPGSTAPFKNGFDPLRLSTVGSESTLAWFQAAYVILVLV